MHTLTKKEIETLLHTFDHDPVNSLRLAVSSVLGHECPTWESMMLLLPQHYTASGLLARQEISSMDDLVKQLVERRTL